MRHSWPILPVLALALSLVACHRAPILTTTQAQAVVVQQVPVPQDYSYTAPQTVYVHPPIYTPPVVVHAPVVVHRPVYVRPRVLVRPRVVSRPSYRSYSSNRGFGGSTRRR